MSEPVSDSERYEVLIQYTEALQDEKPMVTELKLIAAYLPELVKMMQQHNLSKE